MHRGSISSLPTPRRRPSSPALLLAAAVLGLLLSACPNSTGESEAARPLRLGLHGDPFTLDPHLQSEVIAQSVVGNIFDALVAFDVNMQVVGALAESWENPDDLTWRFHLRRDVRFHDGRPFTSADVAYSFERARNHPRSKTSGYLVAIRDLQVLDDYTVDFTTRTRYPILLNKLTFLQIVPRESPDTIDRPIGTGPYRIESLKEGRELHLAALADHWRGPPSHDVVFYFVQEPRERLRLLLAGKLDLMDDVAPEDVARLEREPDFRLESRTGLAVSYIQMNVALEPFTDPRVRRALDLLIDRQALVDEVLHGQAQPLGQMLSPNVFGFAPVPVTERDVDRARGLLAEAGYEDGLDLVLEFRAGRENNVAPIARQLATGGVRVELKPRPWSEMYERLQTGEVSFYFGGWVCTSGDASDLFDDKVHSPDPVRGYGASNSNQFSDPDLDRLIEESGIVDMERRREVFQQALTRLTAAHAYLPLLTPFDLYGVRQDLEWVPRQDGRIYAFEMQRR